MASLGNKKGTVDPEKRNKLGMRECRSMNKNGGELSGIELFRVKRTKRIRTTNIKQLSLNTSAKDMTRTTTDIQSRKNRKKNGRIEEGKVTSRERNDAYNLMEDNLLAINCIFGETSSIYYKLENMNSETICIKEKNLPHLMGIDINNQANQYKKIRKLGKDNQLDKLNKICKLKEEIIRDEEENGFLFNYTKIRGKSLILMLADFFNLEEQNVRAQKLSSEQFDKLYYKYYRGKKADERKDEELIAIEKKISIEQPIGDQRKPKPRSKKTNIYVMMSLKKGEDDLYYPISVIRTNGFELDQKATTTLKYQEKEKINIKNVIIDGITKGVTSSEVSETKQIRRKKQIDRTR